MDLQNPLFKPITENVEEELSINNDTYRQSDVFNLDSHEQYGLARERKTCTPSSGFHGYYPREIRGGQKLNERNVREAYTLCDKHQGIQYKSTQSPINTLDSSFSPRSMKSLPILSPSSSRTTNKAVSPIRSSQTSSNRSDTHVRQSLNSSSSEAVCRICHGSSSHEQLFSPCYCSGSIGLLHVSCLQRWLGSSNKTCCELCNFKFKLERKTKPFKMFLQNPGSRRDKRHLIFDIVCFVVLTPTTMAIAYLCIVGSRMFVGSKIEAILLYCLTVALVTLFCAWMMMCLRHNFELWNDWKQFNQTVRIICEPSNNTHAETSSSERKTPNQNVKLCSVKIKVSTNKSPRTTQKENRSSLTDGNIRRSVEQGVHNADGFSTVNANKPYITDNDWSFHRNKFIDIENSQFEQEPSTSTIQLHSTFTGERFSDTEEMTRPCAKDTYI